MLEVLIHDSRVTGALAGFADTLWLCTKAGRDYFACFSVDYFKLRNGRAHAQHGEPACTVLSLSVQHGLFAGQGGKSNAAISGYTGFIIGAGETAVRINCNDAEIERDLAGNDIVGPCFFIFQYCMQFWCTAIPADVNFLPKKYQRNDFS